MTDTKKIYTLRWHNPSGNTWETIAENLATPGEVFIAIEKLQNIWKIPLEHRPKFYSQLKIIEISESGEKEINVASLMETGQ